MVVVGVSLAFAAAVIALDRSAQETPRSAEAASEAPSVAQAPSTSARPGSPSSVDQLPGVDVHVNDQAGYLFSYPDSWQLTPSGENTDLLSPDGEVEMTFGVAPLGSLREASDSVVQDLTGAFADAKIVARDVERTEQGQPSLVVGGTATDAGGSISFLVITIQGQDRSWAITVRFSGDSKPLSALPAIREIIASFRTSQAVV